MTAGNRCTKPPKTSAAFRLLPPTRSFPATWAPTVQMAKHEFGIETFLVWHAIMGYWAGVDGESLPAYDVHSMPRTYSPDILGYVPDLPNWFGKHVGVPGISAIHRFYNDYHRHLRLQGVDGVKVDNQASVEGVAAGSGGRVAMMQTYHEALEGSAQVHFKGNLINCMSCSNDMLYSTLNSIRNPHLHRFLAKSPGHPRAAPLYQCPGGHVVW